MNTFHEPPQAAGEILRLADHLFREESGKLVSVLTRIFGIERLQLAEDVVQEALVSALQTWPYYGIPKNPAAWITQTAKNLAVDTIRREGRFRDKQAAIAASIEQRPPNAISDIPFDNEIKDDRLRLIFTCCHPLVQQEAQIALALKTLCGFGSGEIAKAFLTTEAAIAKRLTRARNRIRELGIPFEIPVGEELSTRLDGVLQTLYLLFNEGYKASTGKSLIKEELCYEAIHLAVVLANHPITNQPKTHALLALMLFNGARLATRLDGEGHILRLKEQDRERWNRQMINKGMLHLGKAATGNEITRYHLQAAIAAYHCSASDYESTDWERILGLYDQYIQIDDNPVVALNRAVAIGQIHGPAAGIAAVTSITGWRFLNSYYLLYAILGDFEAQLDNLETAAGHFRRAISLTNIAAERSFLEKKLSALEGKALSR
ncbi:MAG: sigma-70 family RNA polymerase sigma factor [Verrucomicrobia bacterium]|nr:sigma-70 family RNA polymerase sigma factor [Verrucomicrobiota bacterium]